MSYTINPVSCLAVNTSIAATFPATFRYALVSVWFVLNADNSGLQIYAANRILAGDDTPVVGFHIELDGPGIGSGLQVSTGDGVEYDFYDNSGYVSFSSPCVAGTTYNLLVSIDSVGQVVQAYLNDVSMVLGGTLWLAATAMKQPVGISANPIGVGAELNFVGTNPCVADAFWDVPSTFFDLTIEANRRKFIDASGFPVYLGAQGELPLERPPLVFLTRGSDAPFEDFLTNRGSSGGVFTTQAGFTASCQSFPSPQPPELRATAAELFFTPTSGFVDLTKVANRRKFFSSTGSVVSLGSDGSSAFGTPPAVFLHVTGGGQSTTADTFAANSGSGGVFAETNGPLTLSVSSPPGASASAPASQNVVGDYRNGNLYVFNLDQPLDDGTQRRWLRRWRALSKPDPNPHRFVRLTIELETGAQVPDGTSPLLELRWSDDGGHTWSNRLVRKAGPPGATAQRVFFTPLGSTRRSTGLDRIFELSSSDQFKVAIMSADLLP